MAVVERHTSPDGLLDLSVALTDGGWSIGFDKFGWHTHGDILNASGYVGTPEEATRQFVDDILASRRVIVLSRIKGNLHDVWVTDDPDHDETKYADEHEIIEKRFWNGEFYATSDRYEGSWHDWQGSTLSPPESNTRSDFVIVRLLHDATTKVLW